MTVAVVLVLVLVVVLGIEGLFRFLEPALPPHRLWYDALPAVRLRQMRALRKTQGGADLVFCGSSVVHSGLDPAAVIEASGVPLTGYNAALHRGFYAVVAPWLERAVVPVLRPKILVLGVSVHDLNDNGPLLTEEPAKYRASLMGRGDLLGRVARRLEPISAAFRHHHLLWRPRQLASSIRHRLEGATAPDPDVRGSKVSLGPHGEWVGFHGREFHTTEAMYDHLAHGCLGDFHVGGTELARVERTIARMKELVPQVVLTTVPYSSQFTTLLPRGQADLDAARATFRAIAERLDVPFLEIDFEGADETHYADLAHCNERGMAACSTSLGTLLGDLLRDRESARAA